VTGMGDFPALPPGWSRIRYLSSGCIDTYRVNLFCVVYVAILGRGDGTFIAKYGSAGTRRRARRNAQRQFKSMLERRRHELEEELRNEHG
jgi:hypothetical protein